MKYYLYSAALILMAILVATLTPFFTNFAQDKLVNLEVPLHSSQVAGVEKYNIPPIEKKLPVPLTSAKAVIIKDLATGTILYQKNANQPLPIASTTKIMTALVASEYFKQNSILIVRSGAAITGSRVGLIYGEDLSFRSLLYGMLLNSGNDAAFTIAENYPGGVENFVGQMNKKAEGLGLKNTHFSNPAGFDDISHFSSASDMAQITEEALKNYQLARIFATKQTSIVSLDKKYTHNLFNLNKLLSSVGGVLGVKTGKTDEAKENLVTLVERNGHKILLVVLGSNDRFGESTNLIEWVYQNFQWP